VRARSLTRSRPMLGSGPRSDENPLCYFRILLVRVVVPAIPNLSARSGDKCECLVVFLKQAMCHVGLL